MNSIYSNAFQIAASCFDVQVEFGLVEPILDGSGNVTGAERHSLQCVNLPVGIAKDLAIKLTEAISNYESAFGEIKLPQGTTQSK